MAPEGTKPSNFPEKYLGDGIDDKDVKTEEKRKLDILERINKKALAGKSPKELSTKSLLTVKDTLSPQKDYVKSKKLKRKYREDDDDKKEDHLVLSTPEGNKTKKKKRICESENLSKSDQHEDSEEVKSPTRRTKNKDKHSKTDSDSVVHKIERDTVGLEESYNASDDGDDDVNNKEQLEDSVNKSLTFDESEDLVVTGQHEGQGQIRHESGSEIGGFTILGKRATKQTNKVMRVLPDWLAHPSVVTDDIRNRKKALDEVSGLDDEMKEKLRENGIHSLFPVQADVVPCIMETLQSGLMIGRAGYRPSDLCVSAPTGSGKTLTFVLPLVQALKTRVVCRTRALVVLPVRDLASQVYRVFKTYCNGTSLKVGLVIGQKTFASEQSSLIRKGVRGYHSLVDILVATPGRLVDHINRTPGFSLSHLRFLVIDEADRVMDEIKQDWLAQVQKAVYQDGRLQPGLITANSEGKMIMPLQKLLFSATLSQNPEKLQQLGLFQPKLFTSIVKDKRGDLHSEEASRVPEPHSENTEKNEANSEVVKGEFVGKYTTPSGLTEFLIESSAAEKPLMMLHLLHHLKFRHILCFTNTAEAAHRLFWLIKLTGGVEVREFSANLHALKRSRLIKQFAAGKIDVLICTDSMARGMDVENVKYIISYERPLYIKTYIHRVGRTARAGKVGIAITLLERKEIFHFKKMMKDAGKEGVKEMKIAKRDLEPLVEAYQTALKPLPEILKNEKHKAKRR